MTVKDPCDENEVMDHEWAVLVDPHESSERKWAAFRAIERAQASLHGKPKMAFAFMDAVEAGTTRGRSRVLRDELPPRTPELPPPFGEGEEQ